MRKNLNVGGQWGSEKLSHTFDGEIEHAQQEAIQTLESLKKKREEHIGSGLCKKRKVKQALDYEKAMAQGIQEANSPFNKQDEVNQAMHSYPVNLFHPDTTYKSHFTNKFRNPMRQ